MANVEPCADQTSTPEILASLTTAVVLLDQDMRIIYLNQAAEDLLQISSSKVHQRFFLDLFLNGDDLRRIFVDALATDQSYTQRKATLMMPARVNTTVDLTITPLFDPENADSYHRLLIEMASMDRYLRIDRDAAIREHHDITKQMARGLAHEIKNPLGGIKGSAQLLARELNNPVLDEYTNIIIEETDRLTALLDRMLGPNSPPTPCSTNIHEPLEKVARLIELEASSDLRVIRDYDPSIPEILLDPELLLQALLNLARNAMQSLESTPNPVLEFVSRIERQFTISGIRHKVVLRIDIKDNGPGVPQDIKEHLFYPMISRRPGGTGLGLTFVQSIITTNGGLIEFESEPGNTVFTIFIPLEQQP